MFPFLKYTLLCFVCKFDLKKNRIIIDDIYPIFWIKKHLKIPQNNYFIMPLLLKLSLFLVAMFISQVCAVIDCCSPENSIILGCTADGTRYENHMYYCIEIKTSDCPYCSVNPEIHPSVCSHCCVAAKLRYFCSGI